MYPQRTMDGRIVEIDTAAIDLAVTVAASRARGGDGDTVASGTAPLVLTHLRLDDAARAWAAERTRALTGRRRGQWVWWRELAPWRTVGRHVRGVR